MRSFLPDSFLVDFDYVSSNEHSDSYSVTFTIDGKEEIFPYQVGNANSDPENPEQFLQSLAIGMQFYTDCEDFTAYCRETGRASASENLIDIVENLQKNCENLEKVLGDDLHKFIKVFNKNRDEDEIQSFLDKFSLDFTDIDSDEHSYTYTVLVEYNGKSFECPYSAGILIKEEDYPRGLLESLARDYHDFIVLCEKDIKKFCSQFGYDYAAYESWNGLQENFEKLGNIFSDEDRKIFVELYSLDPLPFSPEENNINTPVEYKEYLEDLPISDEAKEALYMSVVDEMKNLEENKVSNSYEPS